MLHPVAHSVQGGKMCADVFTIHQHKRGSQKQGLSSSQEKGRITDLIKYGNQGRENLSAAWEYLDDPRYYRHVCNILFERQLVMVGNKDQ
ncbi:hypothetical protein DSO57_1006959 [Entomophthora muscae]|uniref:Uncharacterized protein n=1 Tax=Entomophthora muscae TaxID=34485 RepID=A0ACC2TII7_9FUNG|nr:hypothetical protein DSO57_1006959 [Entomophthora muscae]